MAFIDKCLITIKAGDGGDGMMSWRREAHVPLGGPAGGNGGHGGSVYFVGDHNETSLEHLKYRRKIVAKNGVKGMIKSMHGANAEDTFIKVPLGTVVINHDTNEVLADIKFRNQKFLVAQGGEGGHGNAHFKSQFNKAPTLYELGEIGEEIEIKLELKQIADVGLVGLPNAGKSTLISKLTNAKPKIADYQFTTLNPILGTIDFDNKKVIIADIPGLIEGASEGIGLGHEFLKHIERCKILIHLVSLDTLDHKESVEDSYNIIMNELTKYSEHLLDKKMVLVGSKMDQDIEDENFNKLKVVSKNKNVIKISSVEGTNIKNIKEIILETYKDITDNEIPEEIETFDNSTGEKEYSKELFIEKSNETTWVVESEFLKYWTHRIPLTTNDNLVRYNQKLASVELEPTLKKMGAVRGDIISIYGREVEYED